MTILEAINLSADYLEKKGIDSARLNAEILLADILNCPRMNLYLSFDRPMKKNEIDIYREYISRRGAFEPYQYITGKVEFYGLEFSVNKNVLIPRQETEILVEEVLKTITSSDKPEVSILDIGTGSGNIAVSLAANSEKVQVNAVDISESALEVAGKNAAAHNVAERITFTRNDILNGNNAKGKTFDVIVSNPPYVGSEEYPGLQKEIVEHEPKEALTDNKDGYSFYEAITQLAGNRLNSGGRLYYEVGFDQANNVKEILKKNGLINITAFKDYLGHDRVIAGEKK